MTSFSLFPLSQVVVEGPVMSFQKCWVQEEEGMDQRLLSGRWRVRWEGSVEWEGGCVVGGHQVAARPVRLAPGMLPWLFVRGNGGLLVAVVDPASSPLVTLLQEVQSALVDPVEWKVVIYCTQHYTIQSTHQLSKGWHAW